MRSVFFVKLRGWHGIFLCYRTEVAALFIYQWILYMYINNVLSVIQLTEIVAVSLCIGQKQGVFLGDTDCRVQSPHSVLDETFTYLSLGVVSSMALAWHTWFPFISIINCQDWMSRFVWS